MTPKMTQHGAQLGHFGRSLGSKKSFKNKAQKNAQKRGSEFYRKRAGGPLETHKSQTSDHQKMDRTRPSVPGGTVADNSKALLMLRMLSHVADALRRKFERG